MAAPRRDDRLQAARRLLRVEEGGALVGLADPSDEEPGPASPRITEYVAGVTRRRRYLDFLIDHFFRGNSEKIELRVRTALRLGIYELLYLDTPPHAAVNEAVRVARQFVRPGLAGLVNGILRSVQRTGDRLPEPHTGNEAEDLAIRWSHPTWIVERWLRRFGADDTRRLLEWNNARPYHTLRINTLKIGADEFHRRLESMGAAFEPSPWMEESVRVKQLQPVMAAGFLRDGLCAVQDESAAMIVRLLDPQPGETVIDTCAAPGGKSIYAAIRMKNSGRVIACDINENRLELVRSGADAHGVTIIRTQTADARKLSEADVPPADRVLIDAPCSGLGVLSRRADLRWNRSPGDIADLTKLQGEILNEAGKLVKPGGVLVYGTCTIEPEENEEVVEAFLADHQEFVLEPASTFVPSEMTSGDFYATLPFRHHTDGAFAARMRRREE